MTEESQNKNAEKEELTTAPKKDMSRILIIGLAIVMLIGAFVWMGVDASHQKKEEATVEEETKAQNSSTEALVYTGTTPEIMGPETLANMITRSDDLEVSGTVRKFFYGEWNGTTRSKTNMPLESYNLMYAQKANDELATALGVSRDDLDAGYTWQITANREDGTFPYAETEGYDGDTYGYTVFWLNQALSGNDMGSDLPVIKYNTADKTFEKGTIRIKHVKMIYL